jgi:hypothetical protein
LRAIFSPDNNSRPRLRSSNSNGRRSQNAE